MKMKNEKKNEWKKRERNAFASHVQGNIGYLHIYLHNSLPQF